MKKCQLLKMELKKWNKTVYEHLDNNLRRAQDELRRAQILMDQQIHNEQLVNEFVLKNELVNQAYADRASLLQQIMRMDTEWDRNTSFFHNKLKSRTSASIIIELVDEDNSVKEQGKLQAHILQFYSDINAENVHMEEISMLFLNQEMR
ncbi:hypothetical protein AQUCO_05300023v1 [Aquilegia coerulea]|uniref:Uncharacterized protein n=1 Tax=Aquilegia coerulea TaxID=218851 RepID=A0A2G5CJ95_AQUCA|nr:hypothetical protein AQUCO_05300023v1 [Aquilegia coerulea]